MRWTLVPQAEFLAVTASNNTRPLDREEWPTFVDQFGGVECVYGVRFDAPRDVSLDQTEIQSASGSMDLLRRDADLIKAYRYLYVERADEVFRIGPFKDLDYGHHRGDLPDL